MSIKALWQILSIMLALVLMIIFPIMNSFEKQDSVTRIHLLNETEFFLSQIKQSGEITKSDYENFTYALSNLGYPFDVEINHYKRVFTPIYEDPKDFDSFTGKVAQTEELFSNYEILNTLYPLSPEIESSSYILNKDDYVLITVKSEVKSKYQKLREMFFNTNEKGSFYLRFGGLVQNGYQ